MRRLALCLALSVLLGLPAFAQRNPNAGGGGGNAGGGESRGAPEPRESGGSSGGYSGGGGYTPSGGASREAPSAPSYSPSQSSGGSSADSGGSRESSSPRSHDSGGGSGNGGSTHNSSGSSHPSVQPAPPSHDSSDRAPSGGASKAGGRDFNGPAKPGQPVGLPVRPISPGDPLKGKPATPTQPGGKEKTTIVPVPAPPSNPCLGGSQAGGVCQSCGSGFKLNGQCVSCPSGGLFEGGSCRPQCPGGETWNGAGCVGQGDPCPSAQAKSGSFGCAPVESPAARSCSQEEARLANDDARWRDLKSQAAGACLIDPNGAECQNLLMQVDRAQQQVNSAWSALDHCRHL